MEAENGLRWRMAEMERRVGDLEKANVAVLATRLEYVEHRLDEVGRTMTWILRTFVGLAVTILAGALIVVMTSGPHP